MLAAPWDAVNKGRTPSRSNEEIWPAVSSHSVRLDGCAVDVP